MHTRAHIVRNLKGYVTNTLPISQVNGSSAGWQSILSTGVTHSDDQNFITRDVTAQQV